MVRVESGDGLVLDDLQKWRPGAAAAVGGPAGEQRTACQGVRHSERTGAGRLLQVAGQPGSQMVGMKPEGKRVLHEGGEESVGHGMDRRILELKAADTSRHLL